MGCAPPRSHHSSYRARAHSEASQVPAQGLEGGPHGAQAHRKGLKRAVPSPFPLSLSTLQGPGSSSPRGSRGSRKARKSNRRKEGFGPSGISLPHFPTPIPLVPRPGAASSSQRWGWRGGAGGRRGRPRSFLSPRAHTHTLVFSLSLWAQGWVPWGGGV